MSDSDSDIKSSDDSIVKEKANTPESPTTSEEHEEDRPKGALYSGATTQDWVLIGFSTIAAIGHGSLPAMAFLILGSYVNKIAGLLTVDDINDIVMKLIYLSIAGFICDAIATFGFERASVVCTRRQKISYVDALLQQEIGYFDTNDPLSLSSRLYVSSIQLRTGSGLKVSQFISAVTGIISSYIVALCNSWKMTLIMMICTPVLFLFAAVLFGFSGKKARQASRDYEVAGGLAEEAVSAIKTVTAFNIQKPLVDQYNKLLEISYHGERLSYMFRAFGLMSVVVITVLSSGLGWWIAGKYQADAYDDMCFFFVDDSCFSPGVAMIVILCVVNSGMQFQQITPNIVAMNLANVSSADMKMLILREPEVTAYRGKDATRGTDMNDRKLGDVELSNVTFSYPTRQETAVFKDFSLTIKEGQSVALVGPSGCGKSTIIQLILQYYHIKKGTIKYGGVPTEELDVVQIRNKIALVSQEPRLFCRSLYENVACGIPDRTKMTKEEEYDLVVDSLKKSHAWEFVGSLQDGVMQDVGVGGNLLSGGQKQRVAIARALARKPDLLILDEATSALDNKSEAQVQKAIDSIIEKGYCATITIAHRLSTVRKCNCIFVFNRVGDRSVIVEKGTHDELLDADGLYNRLYTAQRLVEKKSHKEIDEIKKRASIADILSNLDDLEVSRKNSWLNKYKDDIIMDKEIKHISRMKVVKEYRAKKKEERLNSRSRDKELTGTLRRGYGDSFGRYKAYWFIAVLAAALCACFFPLLPVLSASGVESLLDGLLTCTMEDIANKNIDCIDSEVTRDHSRKWAITFTVLAFVGGVLFFIRDYLFAFLSEDLGHHYRKTVFNTILHHDIQYFDDRNNNPGSVSDVLASDCKQIRGVIGDNTWTKIQIVFMIIFAYGIGFWSNWELTLIATIQILATAPGTYFLSASIKKGIQAQLVKGESTDDIMDVGTSGFIMNELVQNLRTIHAYNMQKEFVDMYAEAEYPEYLADMSGIIKSSCIASLSAGMTYLAGALTYWYGGHLMIDDTFGIPYNDKTVLEFVAFIRIYTVFVFVGQAIGILSGFGADAAKGRISLSKIYKTLDYKRVVDVEKRSAKLVHSDDISGALDVHHVEFKYPGRLVNTVYKDLTFKIKPGQTAALVGPSGTGKSTFIQLLERFYTLTPGAGAENTHGESLQNTTGGSIYLDKTHIEEFDLYTFRESMSLVEQMPTLFSSLSIYENIAVGKVGESRERVIGAAIAANADEFIQALPKQYDTPVGLGGLQLSGGQKQRIAIARAILRQPKILLLDEATSALDVESERIVQKALDEVINRVGATTIVVAHRLSTIKNADVIIVLSNDGDGSIVAETGSHEELMQGDGLYKQMILATQE